MKSILFVATFYVLTMFLSPLAVAVEVTFSAGYQSHELDWSTTNAEFDNQDFSDSGYDFGLSIKNGVGKNKRHFIGSGVDVHSISGDQVIGLRAIDYEYALSDQFRLGGFFGAASIDTGLAQHGYYMGLNTNYFFSEALSIGLEFKHGWGLARDRLVDGDPVSDINRPDIFLDYYALGFQLNWRLR